MAMSKREMGLAGVVAALGAVTLGYVLLFSGPSGSLADLQRQYDELAGNADQLALLFGPDGSSAHFNY